MERSSISLQKIPFPLYIYILEFSRFVLLKKKLELTMGILLGFFLVCLIIYAILVTNGLYYLSKLILISWLNFDMSFKLLWGLINLVLWSIAIRFIYFLLLDSKGGTPDMEPVWKFYMGITTVMFLLVFLFGYKSK
jgi:hypothetical protein